ncbi:MAG: diacylglycerol/lipid kinase family protein [Pseudomonadota bacterium]
MDKIFAIINPVSANRATSKEWPGFKKILLEKGYELEDAYTEYPGHGTELSRQALKAGFRTIMSVGGDGTMNEVMNGFFEDGSPVAAASRLVVFSRGTGCDFIKSLGINKGIEDLLAVLQRNEEKLIDVGRADITGRDENSYTRYFANVADIGIGAETANRVNKHSKRLRGKLSFMLGTATTLMLYRNKELEVAVDEETVIKEKMSLVVIANGKYFGGSMKVAPDAVLDDGLFDVIIFGDLSKPDFIRSFPLVYEGRHMSHPKLRLIRGSRVKVKSGGTALLELDGEIPGHDDVEFTIMKKALKLLV